MLATLHPAFVLIQPAESQQRWRDTFFADVERVASKLRELDNTRLRFAGAWCLNRRCYTAPRAAAQPVEREELLSMLALTARRFGEPRADVTRDELMKAVFARYSAGDTITPLRTPIDMPDGSGVVLFMPAFVPAGNDTPAATRRQDRLRVRR